MDALRVLPILIRFVLEMIGRGNIFDRPISSDSGRVFSREMLNGRRVAGVYWNESDASVSAEACSVGP